MHLSKSNDKAKINLSNTKMVNFSISSHDRRSAVVSCQGSWEADTFTNTTKQSFPFETNMSSFEAKEYDKSLGSEEAATFQTFELYFRKSWGDAKAIP